LGFNGVVSAQDFVVLNSNDTLFGRIHISYKLFSKDFDPIVVGVRNRERKLATFSACQINEVKNHRKHYIVRSYDVLERECFAYRVIADGPVKLFDCAIDQAIEIYSVELPNGQFFPVTEKLFYKWILPYYLENPSFKAWYEELNVFFPRRKKDVLGAAGQNKVNRFILKITRKYNEYRLKEIYPYKE